MNEHNDPKKESAVPAGPSTVVGGGKTRWHRSARLKALGLLACAVLAVALVAFGTYRLVAHRTSPKPVGTQATKQPMTVDQRLLLYGDASAEKALDQQIAAAHSDQQKATLYQQKAGIAYDAKDYKDSLQFAQQAESLDPTVGSAELVADAANALGNKSLALQYYKLQLQRMGTIENRDTYTRLKAKIDALEPSNGS